MKVLQIASSLHDWGGIERYVLYLTQGLQAKRHEVIVARPANSRLAQMLAGPDVSLSKKWDFRVLKQYLKILQSHRPYVVHVHFSPDFVMAGLAARLSRVPVRVMTRHVALPWRAGKAKIYRSLWPNIIPVSEAVKRALKKSGVPETSMIVAKAGLPEAKFRRSREAVREDVGISKSSFFAGSFSRLTKEKGVDIFLRAMPRAPGVQALIYGEGPKGEELAKLSSFMRVANQVHFMGRVDDVADHMRAMDVVVIPSIWEEAFPYAALEAFLVGTPVIGADVGGMPEIVTEGETGLLFQKGNSEDLLRALLEAKAQPDRLANMARKARETYESNYTLSLMADRIESAYISFGARL